MARRSRLTKVLHIRLSDEQLEALDRRVEDCGLSRSRLVRRAIMGLPLRGSVDREAIRQLSRIGNNLNQLTKLAHSVGSVEMAWAWGLEECLEEVRDLIEVIGRGESSRGGEDGEGGEG